MNRWRLAVAAVAAVLAVAGAAFALLPRDAAPAPADIGGPFRMTDQDGREVTEAVLKTGPTVVFFGFTYCPEVCPTTLARLTSWMRDLGPAADRLNVLFVSVDPQRDTPAQLKQYLSSFDPRIRGLSGSPEALAAMARDYKAYYSRVELPGGGYTMDHSATLYLFDRKGRFREVIGYGEEGPTALAALKQLVG
jgi:protein SCO1/2